MFDHIRAMSPSKDEDPIDADTISTSIEELAGEMKGPSPEFKEELKEFVLNHAKKVAKMHKNYKVSVLRLLPDLAVT